MGLGGVVEEGEDLAELEEGSGRLRAEADGDFVVLCCGGEEVAASRLGRSQGELVDGACE